MFGFFLFAALFATIANAMTFSYWTYYSNGNCDANNGYDIMEFNFIADSRANEKNCTAASSSSEYRSFKNTVVKLDTWPSVADVVPSKSLYYTVDV
jgi:hypothetical protein